MKIAFLIQDLSTHGGTERTTCCLASEMAKHGWDVSIVSVFAQEGKKAAYEVSDGVRCTFLTQEKYNAQQSKIKRGWLIIRQIKRLHQCRELQEANWIISQKTMASMYMLLAGYKQKTIACEHFRYRMYNALVRWLRNMMYKRLSRLVVLTERDAEIFRQHGVDRVSVIPNMISVDPLPYKGEYSRRIVSVGRLVEQKGFDLLIESVRKIADKMGIYIVQIYGDGPLYEKLKKQIWDYHLQGIIRLKGYSKNIAEIYSQSEIYVMSSRFEGFPMVLLEAAAAGVPIVSFACPEGPSQLLKNGGGLLAKEEDADDLARQLLRMIQDEELRAKCRRELAEVVKPYTPENIFMQWENLIKQFAL